MEVIIITGMSGAGKSQAIDCLEDKNYYCVDNMPPALMMNFISIAKNRERGNEKIAFVMDIRSEEFGTLQQGLEALDENDISYKTIFLEASDEVLVRRYSETRRVHPVTKNSPTVEDFQKEREALKVLRDRADFVIDTSGMKTAQLKRELLACLEDELMEETFVINIMSFGFKYGMPLQADMVFDMRFIPNPFYVPRLKHSTGNSKKVRQYVTSHTVTQRFIKDLNKMINNIIPPYMHEGKFNLNIAFGCTGGQHRSVAMANEFAELFELQGKQVTLKHRDIKNK